MNLVFRVALLLPAFAVQILLKVALAVEEVDEPGDEGQPGASDERSARRWRVRRCHSILVWRARMDSAVSPATAIEIGRLGGQQSRGGLTEQRNLDHQIR